MRYKLACFDLDGTLLDTIGGLTSSLNAARRMNNLKPQTADQVKTFINNGVVRFIERSLAADPGEFSEDLKNKLLKDNVSYYDSHCLDNTQPYNGILEELTRLKSDGLMLACITNKNDEPAKMLIGHFFPGLFDYVRGSMEGVDRKPSAEPVEKCLEALGVKSSEAVYIGDSDTDIKTAENSGLDIISCAWGYRTREFLMENGAVNICSEPIDLRRFMR